MSSGHSDTIWFKNHLFLKILF